MGLMELNGMDTEDNKGGRPSKEEKDDGPRFDGEPATATNDREEWWKDQINTVKEDDETIEEALTKLCERVAVNEITVRRKLSEHGILDTDWEKYRQQNPVYSNDKRIKRALGEVDTDGSSTSDFISEIDSGSSTTDDSTSSNSGLKAMLDKQS